MTEIADNATRLQYSQTLAGGEMVFKRSLFGSLFLHPHIKDQLTLQILCPHFEFVL